MFLLVHVSIRTHRSIPNLTQCSIGLLDLVTILFLYQIKEQERELRVLVLGLDNAGKTTIVKALCGQSLRDIEPTLGFQIHSLEFLGYHLNLWDIGGQSSIRAYWRNYFEQTDGIVWVIDSLDVSRLELVRIELQKVLQQERLAGASLLIWANKQDLQGSLTTDQIAQALHLSSLASSSKGDSGTHSSDDATNDRVVPGNDDHPSSWSDRHWSIHACSAVTGEGLLEGMDWLVKDIGDRIFLLS